MIFDSLLFIVLFFPSVLLIIGISRYFNLSSDSIKLILIAISGIFIVYGGLFSFYVLLISLLINIHLFRHLKKNVNKSRIITIAICFNLILIGFFKYSEFFYNSVSLLIPLPTIAWWPPLPLAISFYTFQIIALYIDYGSQRSRSPKPIDIVFFVSFFPQLIAGPIVRFHQIDRYLKRINRFRFSLFNIGMCFFSIGLFKKAFVADSLSIPSDLLFNAASSGFAPSLLESWAGVLAYTFQIYFDFSGYSDIAIGLALMLGVRLPFNFNSPYKSTSIIEFWRRWHITLSHFLRDYLYVPLGGGREGHFRRHVNLLLTMLLGGLWHGASFNFIIWGGVHGFMLIINHVFRVNAVKIPRQISFAITQTFVLFSWVIFRSTDIESAFRIYAGLLGVNGILLPTQAYPFLSHIEILHFLNFGSSQLVRLSDLPVLALSFGLCFLCKNSQQIILSRRKNYKPIRVAILASIALVVGFLSVGSPTPFIYFRF